MVTFTSNLFIYDKNSKVKLKNWFKALNKYYSGVEVSVFNEIVDYAGIPGYRLKEDLEKKYKNYVSGVISMEFFNALPIQEIYFIVTERYWSEKATIRTLGEFRGFDDCTINEPTGIVGKLWFHIRRKKVIEKAASEIEHSIGTREFEMSTDMGCQYRDFDEINEDEIMQVLTRCNRFAKEEQSAKDVVSGKESTPYVQYFHYFPQHKMALFASKKTGLMMLTLSTCRHIHMDGFDLDEGFGNTTLGAVLNQDFNVWKQRFEDTRGESWNEPIFKCPFREQRNAKVQEVFDQHDELFPQHFSQEIIDVVKMF